MRVLAPEDAERVYRLLEPNYPYGKRCSRCGEYHDVRSFALSRAGGCRYGYRLASRCLTCHAEYLADYRQKNRVVNRVTRTAEPVPEPTPSLVVGKRYRIEDTGREWWGIYGGDSHRPDVYVGPCVARWGRNWGIKTSTGIRCFTPSTLVGLDVREVGKSA